MAKRLLMLSLILLGGCVPLEKDTALTWLLKSNHTLYNITEYRDFMRIRWQSPLNISVETNIPKEKIEYRNLTEGQTPFVEFVWVNSSDLGSVQELFDKYVNRTIIYK